MCVAEYFLFQRNMYFVALYMAQFVMCQQWTVKHGFLFAFYKFLFYYKASHSEANILNYFEEM